MSISPLIRTSVVRSYRHDRIMTHEMLFGATSFFILHFCVRGRTGLMVRASDSGSGDPGSILGRVGVFVSLSKRHLLPKSTGNTQE